MHKDLEAKYHQMENIRDWTELISFIRDTLQSCSDVFSERDTLLNAQTEMALQYQQMKDELTGTKKANEVLAKENLRLSEQLGLRSRDLFGRNTEKTSEILEKVLSNEETKDPLDEDQMPSQDNKTDTLQNNPQVPENQKSSEENAGAANGTDGSDNPEKSKSKKGQGKKKSGKRELDLSHLPTHTKFLLDVDELNRKFGENNWTIRGWTNYRTVESVRTTKYVKNTYVPVISAGLEHELYRMPYNEKLLKGSLVSSSLLAEIMYDKFTLGMPFYRIESDLQRDDVIISRANMANWCIRFSIELFSIVYDYLCLQLLETGYNQSDETTLEVINDGRNAGAVSYMWVHTTSELLEGNPIVVFCYELTRNTDHLREFYLKKGYRGFITCDAYSSYGLLEKEAEGSITICGCMMHARRRFVMALLVLNLKGKSVKNVEALPEYQALTLLDDIYQADEPLKELSPSERLERRNTEVREKVDAFFDYLHKLRAEWNDSYTERFQDAVNYSINNEKHLRMFLEDGSIPIDNGFCERSIRTMACGRRSWLFCYSVEGAEAMATLYTLAETAKACGAHPYYYFKYLLDELPKKTVGSDPDMLPNMMPWSEAYKAYEKQEKEKAVRYLTDQEPVKPPKSPKVNRRPLAS